MRTSFPVGLSPRLLCGWTGATGRLSSRRNLGDIGDSKAWSDGMIPNEIPGRPSLRAEGPIHLSSTDLDNRNAVFEPGADGTVSDRRRSLGASAPAEVRSGTLVRHPGASLQL